jgi:SAM-dependent methyltransferase
MQATYQRQTFDLEKDHWWYKARRAILLSQLAGLLKSNGIRRPDVLEVGCGGGTILADLQSFANAVGIDPCPEAVERAKAQAKCPVYQGAVPDDIPENIGHFDAICLFDVIEHLDDDVTALASLKPLLKPNGAIVITVPALPWLYGVHDRINEHRRRYSASLLSSRLAAAGLDPIKRSYFNTLLCPLLIPAIAWRNFRRAGHHFEVRSRLAPALEAVFKSEQRLLNLCHLPFGLSLFAIARPCSEAPTCRH